MSATFVAWTSRRYLVARLRCAAALVEAFGMYHILMVAASGDVDMVCTDVGQIDAICAFLRAM